jgi:hypothetical protein
MPALSNDITVTINKFCAGGLLAPTGARRKRKHSQEEMS